MSSGQLSKKYLIILQPFYLLFGIWLCIDIVCNKLQTIKHRILICPSVDFYYCSQQFVFNGFKLGRLVPEFQKLLLIQAKQFFNIVPEKNTPYCFCSVIHDCIKHIGICRDNIAVLSAFKQCSCRLCPFAAPWDYFIKSYAKNMPYYSQYSNI